MLLVGLGSKGALQKCKYNGQPAPGNQALLQNIDRLIVVRFDLRRDQPTAEVLAVVSPRFPQRGDWRILPVSEFCVKISLHAQLLQQKDPEQAEIQHALPIQPLLQRIHSATVRPALHVLLNPALHPFDGQLQYSWTQLALDCVTWRTEPQLCVLPREETYKLRQEEAEPVDWIHEKESVKSPKHLRSRTKEVVNRTVSDWEWRTIVQLLSKLEGLDWIRFGHNSLRNRPEHHPGEEACRSKALPRIPGVRWHIYPRIVS